MSDFPEKITFKYFSMILFKSFKEDLFYRTPSGIVVSRLCTVFLR